MKKLFYKLFALSLLSLALSVQVHAQSEFVNDFMGRPLMLTQYVDVKGSPFLYDEWKVGTVELQNGKTFTGVKLKFDQVEDELIFQNSRGDALLFIEPVARFEIEGRKFQKGYSATDNAIYEVLANGSAQLLKRSSKKVFEEVPYSSASKLRSIIQTDTYFLSTSKDAPLVKVKKDKKSLLQALPGKQAELNNYVKEEKLDLRQEPDMAKLVAYYNSL